MLSRLLLLERCLPYLQRKTANRAPYKRILPKHVLGRRVYGNYSKLHVAKGQRAKSAPPAAQRPTHRNCYGNFAPANLSTLQTILMATDDKLVTDAVNSENLIEERSRKIS